MNSKKLSRTQSLKAIQTFIWIDPQGSKHHYVNREFVSVPIFAIQGIGRDERLAHPFRQIALIVSANEEPAISRALNILYRLITKDYELSLNLNVAANVNKTNHSCHYVIDSAIAKSVETLLSKRFRRSTFADCNEDALKAADAEGRNKQRQMSIRPCYISQQSLHLSQ